MSDSCGHPTQGGDGPPCQNPATEGDSCWIEAHGGHASGHGRPSKLTLERQEEIAQAIENGKSDTVAARMAGITPRTFINWVERGEEEEEGPYADFFQRLTHAWGQGQNYWEERLAAVTDDPATIMAILKTQYPETEWGDTNRGEQSGGVVVNLDAERTVTVDPETLEVIDE